MKHIKSLTLLLFIVLLSGCASGAKLENMVYSASPSGKDKIYDKKLKEEITLGHVIGGKETNPLWTSEISSSSFMDALKQSLASQGLFSENGDYELRVQMLEVNQPLFGLDLTVTTHIKYTLVNLQTKNTLFDQTITAKHTSTFGDSPIAIQRLRLANEGSAKRNIENLLNHLALLDVKKQTISIK